MNRNAFYLAALLGATTAHAEQVGKAHVSIGVGQSRFHDCIGECGPVRAVKVTGGYAVGNGFRVEVGFVDLGRFGEGLKLPADVPTGTAFIASSSRSRGITAGGTYLFGLGGKWGAKARLGVSRLQTRRDVVSLLDSVQQSASVSYRSTKPYVGLAVTYSIGRASQLEVGVDLMRYDSDLGSHKNSLASIGVSFEF